MKTQRTQWLLYAVVVLTLTRTLPEMERQRHRDLFGEGTPARTPLGPRLYDESENTKAILAEHM